MTDTDKVVAAQLAAAVIKNSGITSQEDSVNIYHGILSSLHRKQAEHPSIWDMPEHKST